MIGITFECTPRQFDGQFEELRMPAGFSNPPMIRSFSLKIHMKIHIYSYSYIYEDTYRQSLVSQTYTLFDLCTFIC